MKWWMFGLSAVVLLGCGKEASVAKKTAGPKVDITVQPLRWKTAPAVAEGQRSQRFSPTTASPKRSEPAAQVRQSDEPSERPRRKRRPKRDRKRDDKPKKEQKKTSFEELSADERRRLIEGG